MLLLERVFNNRKDHTKSMFTLHRETHDAAQVNTTTYQAKKLGLKYLGFGRYGKVMMPVQPGMGGSGSAQRMAMAGDMENLVGGQMMVTHVVKRGLLVPVSVAPPENLMYPKEEECCHAAYHHRSAEKIAQEVKKLVGWKRGDWNRGMKALKDYTGGHHDAMNAVLHKEMRQHAHPTIIDKINRLDKLFTFPINKLRADLPTYFATSAQPRKVGDAFEFKGYLSTATDPKVAAGFLGGRKANVDVMDVQHEDKKKSNVPSIIQLDLKTGQRVLDVMALSGGPDYVPQETDAEFILPRQSRIIITDGPIYMKHAMFWRAELDQTDSDFDPENGV